jgi:hypothetical protein
VTITVIDVLGKTRKDIPGNHLETESLTIPLQNLEAGIYFITLESSGTLYKQKFVKL